MNEYELIKDITDLIKFVLGIQIFIIIAFIIQFIANIIIIIKLPKIDNYKDELKEIKYAMENNNRELIYELKRLRQSTIGKE